MVDARLKPWMDLADELESFAEFMHAARMVPEVSTPAGGLKFMDVGEATVARMRAAAMEPWRFTLWKKWGMEGAFTSFYYTFHRLIAEGAFYGIDNARGDEEMMRRLSHMGAKLKKLSG